MIAGERAVQAKKWRTRELNEQYRKMFGVECSGSKFTGQFLLADLLRQPEFDPTHTKAQWLRSKSERSGNLKSLNRKRSKLELKTSNLKVHVLPTGSSFELAFLQENCERKKAASNFFLFFEIPLKFLLVRRRSSQRKSAGCGKWAVRQCKWWIEKKFAN